MKIPSSWQRFIPASWRGKGHRILRDTVAMFSAIRNPQVPFAAKAMTLASVVYLIVPVDLIPDFIPVIGMADDLAFIPLACYLASRMVPSGVMERLRDDAEYKLLRWGPRLRSGLMLFLVAWLLLAGIGGCLFLRGSRGSTDSSRRNAEAVNWEHRLIREYDRQAGE